MSYLASAIWRHSPTQTNEPVSFSLLDFGTMRWRTPLGVARLGDFHRRPAHAYFRCRVNTNRSCASDDHPVRGPGPIPFRQGRVLYKVTPLGSARTCPV